MDRNQALIYSFALASAAGCGGTAELALNVPSTLECIMRCQRNGDSYGYSRREYPELVERRPLVNPEDVQDPRLIKDGVEVQGIPFGSIVHPEVMGVKSITLFGHNVGVVDTGLDGKVDRIISLSKNYDPKTHDQDAFAERSFYPGTDFPQDVADNFLKAVASVILEYQNTLKVGAETLSKYSFALAAVHNETNKIK